MTEIAAPAVDLVHLDRYTGGDRPVNDEILGLFHTQCNEIVAKLEAMVEGLDEQCHGANDFSGNNKERWHKTLHSLKGAARGIGAFQLLYARSALFTATSQRHPSRPPREDYSRRLETDLRIIWFLEPWPSQTKRERRAPIDDRRY